MGVNRAKRRARRAAKRAAFLSSTAIGQKSQKRLAVMKGVKRWPAKFKKLPPGEAKGARDLQEWSKRRKADR